MNIHFLVAIYFVLSWILGFIIKELPSEKWVNIGSHKFLVVTWPFIAVTGISSVVLGAVFFLNLDKKIITYLWWIFLFSFPGVFTGAQKSYLEKLNNKSGIT